MDAKPTAAALIATARAQLEKELEPSDPRRAMAHRALGEALAALDSEPSGLASEVESDPGRIGFLSTVCHDLKDPLAAVMMGSSFLLRSHRSDDPARTTRMAEAIQRAGARMSVLLQNLTDFVHLTTGRRHLAHRDLPLDPLIERALDKVRPQATTATVTLQHTRADLTAICDAEAIALALDHLLANALRYSPPTSTVKVTTARTADRVAIRVADQGRGIPPARLPHLFDPYWNARQKARDGVGLGLGIVTAIARAHGHPAEVATGPTGTTITLRLPASAPASSPKSSATSA